MQHRKSGPRLVGKHSERNICRQRKNNLVKAIADHRLWTHSKYGNCLVRRYVLVLCWIADFEVFAFDDGVMLLLAIVFSWTLGSIVGPSNAVHAVGRKVWLCSPYSFRTGWAIYMSGMWYFGTNYVCFVYEGYMQIHLCNEWNIRMWPLLNDHAILSFYAVVDLEVFGSFWRFRMNFYFQVLPQEKVGFKSGETKPIHITESNHKKYCLRYCLQQLMTLQ